MLIISHGYNADRLALGDKLIIGNGCYGYRGTLEEHTKKHCVALNAGGFYDRCGNGWREPVNMPNPLFAQVKINGVLLDEKQVTEHTEQLNLDNGTFSRTTTYNVNGVQVTLSSDRFFLQTRNDLLVSQFTLQCSCRCDVVVRSGIDCDVWNINGTHFYPSSKQTNPLKAVAITNEGKNLFVELTETATVKPSRCQTKGNKLLNVYNVSGNFFQMERYCRLHTDLVNCEPLPALGYNRLVEQNNNWWTKKWQSSGVEIVDQNNLQLAVQYSIYQLIIYAPQVEGISISARGLSGQTYKGAVFWDTEMFLVPFYLQTDVETAKRLIRYRIATLDGAKQKAQSYGYDGAFFAWESQDGGYDACSDFNVIDVFTNRPVRTYFKDKQIHISADIAVCLYNVYKQTKDVSLLENGGAELLIECAKFYYSRSYYNHVKQRFELLDVMGPDEYHERTNNNAYTNYMAHETAVVSLKTMDVLKKLRPKAYAELADRYKTDLKNIARFKNKLYLPQPNEQGVIQQFDDYFKLEDVYVDTVKSRLVHPKEYWGGNTGVATPTRVIKQADVVALMCVLPHRFSSQVKKANYLFYLPYTEHGSSLSASMYAQCACMVGLQDDAYLWFQTTATCDLVGGGKKYAGNLYIGGTHPAACGGTWLTITKGFFSHGLQSLPKQVQRVTYRTQRNKRSLSR